MSNKQELQRNRSYFKFVVVGLNKPIHTESLTSDELYNWQLILEARDRIIALFENNSRSLGLNVPEHKCWCGKPAKEQIFHADKMM